MKMINTFNMFRLSFEEFMGEESRAERLFKLMDKDGDGFVTKTVNFNFVFIQTIGANVYSRTVI